MTDRWPETVAPFQVMFHPDVPSRSGGQTLTGDEQVVVSSGGRWRATLSFNIRRTFSGRPQDRVLAYRTMLARSQGRSNPFLIGPYDFANSPGAVSGTPPGDVPHSDETSFSDGSLYHQPTAPAVIAGDTATGANSCFVVMLSGQAPEPGQYFSVGERLYLIATARFTGVTDGAAVQYALTFWPTVREAFADGATCEFDDPICKMRFAADKTGEFAAQRLYDGTPSIDCVEWGF